MQAKLRKLKLIRIPPAYRTEMHKKSAIKAAKDVFSPLFSTLNSQKPTAKIETAKKRLSEAYEAYEAVIHETYDQVFDPGESTIETAQRFI